MYDEIKKLYKNLSLNYNKQPDKDIFELWYEELKDYDIYYLKETCNKIKKEDKFFPTLSRFMEVLNEIPNHHFTEKEKIERWDFVPECCKKEIKKTILTKEEQKELEEMMKEYE